MVGPGSQHMPWGLELPTPLVSTSLRTKSGFCEHGKCLGNGCCTRSQQVTQTGKPPYFDVSSLHIRAPSNSRLASSQAQVKQKTEPLSVLLFWEKSGNGLHWMTLVILPFMNQSQWTREHNAPVTSLRNTYSLTTNVVRLCVDWGLRRAGFRREIWILSPKFEELDVGQRKNHSCLL